MTALQLHHQSLTHRFLIYSIMKFITNKNMMTKAVVNAGFDVKKLPLGELELETLNQANKVLKNLESAIKSKDENKLKELS